MNPSRKLLAVALATAAAIPVVGWSVSAAAADETTDAAATSLVEDYSYPGADKILAERGIKLLRGSGSIMLADCPVAATTELIWVATINGNVCFKASADTGYLTMEIGEVYSLRGDKHDTSATVTVDDETEHHDLVEGQWHGVGIGEDETKPLATLLELRVGA